MHIFYFLSLIPIIIGAFLFWKFKAIHWEEFLASSAVALLLSGIFHGLALSGMTKDEETLSGQITRAVHYPKWIEEYQQRHSETTYSGSGKNRTSHTRVWYTTEHRTHPEYWDAETSLNDSHNITQIEFEDIRSKFNNLTTETPYKSGFDGGDRNIYVSYNKSGYVFPATCHQSFENRIKAAPTVFSFIPVPKEVKVYEYPKNDNWRVSDRLLGTAKRYFNQLDFDQLNSYLGPYKHCNLIIVGIPDNAESKMGDYQQAKWINGRKNDLVVVFGGGMVEGKPSWVKCFGWTENELVKRNLETLFLTNKLGKDLLSLVKFEVVKNFFSKDWKSFDYITIYPATCYVAWFVIIQMVVQVGLWIWFFMNKFGSDGEGARTRW